MDASVERPPVIRKRRSDAGVKRGARAKIASNTEESKHVVIGMLSIAVDTIYRTAAISQGDHWKLNQQENITLSVALHEALETLPGESYEKILQLIGQYGPWVALGWTAYNITKPRIDASRKFNANKAKGAQAGQTPTIREFRNNIGERYTVATPANNGNDDTGVTQQNVG